MRKFFLYIYSITAHSKIFILIHYFAILAAQLFYVDTLITIVHFMTNFIVSNKN